MAKESTNMFFEAGYQSGGGKAAEGYDYAAGIASGMKNAAAIDKLFYGSKEKVEKEINEKEETMFDKLPPGQLQMVSSWLVDKKLEAADIQAKITGGKYSEEEVIALQDRYAKIQSAMENASNQLDGQATASASANTRVRNSQTGVKNSITMQQELLLNAFATGVDNNTDVVKESFFDDDGTLMYKLYNDNVISAKDIDLGSEYDSTFENKVDSDLNEVMEQGTHADSELFKAALPEKIRKMKEDVKSNPSKIKDLIYQREEFKPLIDQLISKRSGIPIEIEVNGEMVSNPKWEEYLENQPSVDGEDDVKGFPTYSDFNDKIKQEKTFPDSKAFITAYEELIYSKFQEGEVAKEKNNEKNNLNNSGGAENGNVITIDY